jgi:hypothetical protein
MMIRSTSSDGKVHSRAVLALDIHRNSVEISQVGKDLNVSALLMATGMRSLRLLLKKHGSMIRCGR